MIFIFKDLRVVSFPRCTTGLNRVLTLLGVVASVCTPLPTYTQQLSRLLPQQCWELLRPFIRSLTADFKSVLVLEVKGTPAWRLQQSFINLGTTFFWISVLHMKYCTDLILGKAFCIFIFFHFPRLSVLNCLHFYFGCCDSENRE